ncbi:hypothetical protein ACJX0J_004348 (mitochondrion) [Zea mays]
MKGSSDIAAIAGSPYISILPLGVSVAIHSWLQRMSNLVYIQGKGQETLVGFSGDRQLHLGMLPSKGASIVVVRDKLAEPSDKIDHPPANSPVPELIDGEGDASLFLQLYLLAYQLEHNLQPANVITIGLILRLATGGKLLAHDIVITENEAFAHPNFLISGPLVIFANRMIILFLHFAIDNNAGKQLLPECGTLPCHTIAIGGILTTPPNLDGVYSLYDTIFSNSWVKGEERITLYSIEWLTHTFIELIDLYFMLEKSSISEIKGMQKYHIMKEITIGVFQDMI